MEVEAKRLNSPLPRQGLSEASDEPLSRDSSMGRTEESEPCYSDGEADVRALERAREGRARQSRTPLTSEWERGGGTESGEEIPEEVDVASGFYHECARMSYRAYRALRDEASEDEVEDGPHVPVPPSAGVKLRARKLNAKAKLLGVIAKVAQSREKVPPGEPSASALSTIIQDDLAILLEVTKRTGKPKGLFFRAIQTATSSLLDATSKLVRKASETEELAKRVEEMRAELDQLRAEMASRPAQVTPPAPIPDETPPLSMREIGAMVDAKIAGIADRLLPERRLRPPLAADRSAARERPMAPIQDETRVEVARPPRKRRGPRRRRAAAVLPVADLPAVPSRAAPSVAPAREPRTDSWATVAARKAPPKKKEEPRSRPSPPSPRKAKKGRGAKYRRRRRADTEAVTITLPEGSPSTYAEVLATAQREIRLEEVGVSPEEMRARRTRTGGMLYELSGPGCAEKASRLAERLSASLDALGVRVSRPVREREIRVLDIDDAMDPKDVARHLASAGGCAVDAVKVGGISRAPRRLGVARVRCPLAAAQRLLTSGHFVLGWGRARVEALEAKAAYCFHCLECGHVGLQCPNKGSDRGARCFKCSEPGHTARECKAEKRRCPLCADMGLPHEHRLGSGSCAQSRGVRKRPPRRGEVDRGAAVAAPMDTDAVRTERAVEAGPSIRAAPAR